MKKITIFSIALLFTALVFGQSNEEPCLTCDGNRIDFTKGASAIGTRNESTGINSVAAGYMNLSAGNNPSKRGFKIRAYDNPRHPKGIYLLTITTQDKVFTEKVILQ